MPEHNLEAFDIFQHFIYTGSVFSAHRDDATEDASWDDEYIRFERCWELGEKLMSTNFKDAIVDALIDKITSEEQYPTGLQGVVYRSLRKDSAIRKLFVDISIWGWDHDTMKALQREEDNNAEFLCDLAIKLHKLHTLGPDEGGSAPYLEDNTCVYHEHVAEDKPCYKTMF